MKQRAGNTIALDPRGVFVADTGAEIDTSREAAIEFVDAPTAATAATIMTSLFQTNMIGFRVERFVGWQAVASAVKYLAA